MEPSTAQRAFAVAAVRALGPRAEGACARRWPDSPSLRAFAAGLARDPARLAGEQRRLARPKPVGLEQVHPSWYETPPRSKRADARLWLERRAYGELVDLSPGVQQPAALERLSSLDGDALVELIERLGRRRVATAFLSASRAQIAQLCVRLGEPRASQLLDELGQVGQSAKRDEVRAARSALLHVDVEAEDGGRTLFLRAGSAWLAPAVAARGGDALRRLAQRMPRPAGLTLLLQAATPGVDGENAAVLALAALLATERPRA
jgi:hypothetical protein